MMLILFTALAAGILWLAVSKATDENLDKAKSCYETIGKVLVNGDYTCYYDNIDQMHVSIDVGDIELEALKLALSYGNSSDIYELTNTLQEIENIREYGEVSTEVKVPDKNSGVTYVISEVTEEPVSIEAFPILNGNLCEGDVFLYIETCFG
jgi:hypothetical protein